MLNNFLCKIDGGLIAIIVLDILLILAVAGLFVWYYLKKKRTNAVPVREERVERLNDERVLPEETAPVEQPKVYEDDNAVLHFVNQITDINEEANTELNSSAVIVNHEVEQHTKKAVDKQAINNFVEIGGEKRTITKEERVATFNRGTNAFQNATNFVNTIKTEQTVVEEQPAAPKKPAAPKAAAPKTAAKTTAKKTTTKK